MTAPIQIHDDLWIGPLDGLRKPIIAASEPPGENWQVHRMDAYRRWDRFEDIAIYAVLRPHWEARP